MIHVSKLRVSYVGTTSPDSWFWTRNPSRTPQFLSNAICLESIYLMSPGRCQDSRRISPIPPGGLHWWCLTKCHGGQNTAPLSLGKTHLSPYSEQLLHENPDKHNSRSDNWDAGSAQPIVRCHLASCMIVQIRDRVGLSAESDSLQTTHIIICSMIQSMAWQKRPGARTQPWRTPEVVVKRSEVADPNASTRDVMTHE